LSLPDVPRAQPLPPDLAAALAQAWPRLGLSTQIAPLFFDEVPSTNDVAGTLADGGSNEGTIVIADMQTAGRGRQGRVWASPPGAGLYVSIVLRPHAHAVSLVTLAAGVAIAEGIQAATGLATALKWPNDLMVPPAFSKLAGILAEGRRTAVVLGFGINLRRGVYPPEVAARATSIEGELGRAVDRGLVLAECLAALRTRYDEVQSGRGSAVIDRWRNYARPLLGRSVEWDSRDGVLHGVAEDVDDAGALVVRTPEGSVRVISGEVRWT
jgi:BirA family transcriptional regulator, biotin operon repressor / biotin---[acetyl-CoA-carboxylase] ligase